MRSPSQRRRCPDPKEDKRSGPRCGHTEPEDPARSGAASKEGARPGKVSRQRHTVPCGTKWPSSQRTGSAAHFTHRLTCRAGHHEADDTEGRPIRSQRGYFHPWIGILWPEAGLGLKGTLTCVLTWPVTQVLLQTPESGRGRLPPPDPEPAEHAPLHAPSNPQRQPGCVSKGGFGFPFRETSLYLVTFSPISLVVLKDSPSRSQSGVCTGAASTRSETAQSDALPPGPRRAAASPQRASAPRRAPFPDPVPPRRANTPGVWLPGLMQHDCPVLPRAPRGTYRPRCSRLPSPWVPPGH